MKRMIWGIGAMCGMLVLILDSQTALSAAKDGIQLCLTCLIPSLFPFFILSGLITHCLCGTETPLLRPLGKLCGIPSGSESLFLTGLLAGYPVGARCVADAWRKGILTKPEAERMLAFCNNAGPAFLFGMVGILFPEKQILWLLWGVHILSAVWTAALIPGKSNRIASVPAQAAISLPLCVGQAVRTMATVCGWVLFFRILIGYAEKWILPLLAPVWRPLLIGLLELSNGCWSMQTISDPSIRFLTVSLLLAAGGCCVGMQTVSVCQGLSLRLYFTGKSLQCIASAFLSCAVVFDVWWLPALLFLPLLRKSEKRSSIPQVNGI